MANPYADLVKARARAYALGQGATPAEADAFASSAVAIAWSESQFDPTAVGDNGASVGLFQLHERGRGAGMSVAQRQDPETNIARSLPELFAGFRTAGGAAAFSRDPAGTVAEVSRIAQRPAVSAHAQAVRTGVFSQGLRYAMGETPEGGPLAPVTTAAGPGSSQRPRVVLPVQAPVTSDFGNPFPMDGPGTYQGRTYAHFNKGLDFGAAGGTPVVAPVSGTVVFAGDDGAGWGPRVVIRDAEGFDHSLGHLDARAMAVAPGQRVEAGTRVGAVASGAVGRSSGAHLSWDITKNGELVDPSPWYGKPAVNAAIAHDPAKALVPTYLSGSGSGAPGATAMVTGAGSGIDPGMEAALATALKQITDLQGKQAALQRQIDAETDPQKKEQLQTSLYTINQTLTEATKNYATLYGTVKGTQTKVPSVLDIIGNVAGIENTQFQNRMAAFDAGVKLIGMQLQQALGIAGIQKDLAIAFENAKQTAATNAIAKGNLDLNGVASVVEAQAKQAVAETARAAEVLARAKFIDEATFRNIERALPPGTEYVPGFEPNAPIAQALGRLGVAFQGLRATPVNWDEVAAERSIARAEAVTPQVPAFDIQGVRDVAAANQQIAPYTPVQITPGQVGVPAAVDLSGVAAAMPQVPDYSGYIAMLLGGGSGVPEAGGAGTQRPPANPTNAALGADPDYFITAEAQAAGQSPVPAPREQAAQHGSVWRGIEARTQPAAARTGTSAGAGTGTGVAVAPMTQNPLDFILRPRRRQPAGAAAE